MRISVRFISSRPACNKNEWNGMVCDQYDREESKRKSALSQIEFSRQKKIVNGPISFGHRIFGALCPVAC